MKEILKAINNYERALSLLDDYDHQCLKMPKGNKDFVEVTYEECRILIDSMKFDSTIFGVEKDGSFKSSLNAIYQTAFGNQIYETIEEKAANLLYFVTKNHSFVDGNKRIAASVFLLFLHKNNLLYKDGIKVLSDEALVALTILIAQSKPEEKETMVKLTMNFIVK
jgi:death-on-curing family protein